LIGGHADLAQHFDAIEFCDVAEGKADKPWTAT
jgi:hypothetical protein